MGIKRIIMDIKKAGFEAKWHPPKWKDLFIALKKIRKKYKIQSLHISNNVKQKANIKGHPYPEYEYDGNTSITIEFMKRRK